MRSEPEPRPQDSSADAAQPLPAPPPGRDLLSRLDRGVSAAERALLAAEEERRREEIDRLRHRLAGYDRLAACSRALTSILDPEKLLSSILREVVALSGVDRGFLLLAGSDGELSIECGYDAVRGALAQEEESSVSRSVARDAYLAGRVQWISDALEREDLRNQESIHQLQLSVVISIPMVVSKGPIGVLYLDSRRAESLLVRGDQEILEAFAAQAAIAVENARLHQDLLEARAGLERENRDLRRALPGAGGVGMILGKSPEIELLRRRIAQVQEAHSPVLILGETGSGKDLVAQAIHSGSSRSSRPILPIHCGALPADLLESEMFGHKRGAFTGALQDKHGLFEAADGGTLFLDEIGEMPMKLQVKLLRALESGEIRRVGENHSRRVDVRILSATNRDLKRMIGEGTFREDLYYRLKVVTLEVPPLRERREDILFLAEHFLRHSLTTLARPYSGFTEGAVRFLLDHSWPGNVRELRNVIEGACVFLPMGRALDAEDLLLAAGRTEPLARRPADNESGYREFRQDAERQVIIDALERHDWNVSRAAKTLGISRQHLHTRIRQYKLGRPRRKGRGAGHEAEA